MSFTLSSEQRRAVERGGQDVCVVAGPGSGKTRVLTERFAWLVEQQGVDPTRILAITFTEKAAIEIKQRLVARFAGRTDLRESIERAWVSTIHGFCTRLLKEHAVEAGLAPDFTVLDQAAAQRLQREAAEEALDGLFRERKAEMRRLLEAVDLSTTDGARQTDLAAALLEVYESLCLRGAGLPDAAAAAKPAPSSAGQARRIAEQLLAARLDGPDAPALKNWLRQFLALPELPVGLSHFDTLAAFSFNLTRLGRHPLARELKQEVLPRLESEWIAAFYDGLDGLLHEALARLHSGYLAAKRGRAAVDFSDLETFTAELLDRDAGVRYETHARFDEILMDELQDTNRMQWRLVNLLGTRLFAVGDLNQSIYGFRYADPEVFAEYRERLRADGAEIDELRGNYRSRAEILETVARALDGQPGIEPRKLEALRAFPPSSGPPVELLVGRGNDPAAAEAALVAGRIRHWRDSGAYAFADMAVLVRTIAAMEPFEAEFDRRGIPFLVSGGRGFLEARETRDILLLLAALVNPLDEVALAGVLRSPLVGLRDQDILALFQEGGREAWQAEFERRFGALRRLAGFRPPDLLVARALDACGYTAHLPERARANVDKLLAWMRREHRRRPRPLAELLEDLEALRESETLADAPPPETGDVVRLMTVHAAKGLEFPVVFAAALHKGTDNKSRPLLFSPEWGWGVKWRNPATGEGVSDPVHVRLKQQAREREQREGDRLLYVAMTRAMDRLVLSYAERKRASKWQQLVAGVVPAASPIEEAVPVEAAPDLEAPVMPTQAEGLRHEVAAGQHDAAVAATSVALFAVCPRRYFLARYLGLDAAPDGSGTSSAELGQQVHRALAGEPVASAEAAAVAARFNASPLGRRAARAGRTEREFDFLFETGGLILRGQIDLWFEDHELVVVDYKTGREDPAHHLQLRLYALALERYAGRLPDRAFLYFAQRDRAEEIGLAPEHLEAARQAVLALREAQDKLRFPVNEGEWCGRCGFRGGVCPVGASSEPGVWRPSSSPGPATTGS
jgi:ATP-dependent helicase/nuclease subunit A